MKLIQFPWAAVASDTESEVDDSSELNLFCIKTGIMNLFLLLFFSDNGDYVVSFA